MKHILVWTTVFLVALWVLAAQWEPAFVDQRIVRLGLLRGVADADGDQAVDPDEAAAFFARQDANGDGFVSPADATDLLDELLDAADDDGDSRVAREEYDRLVHALDRTGDGALSGADVPKEPPVRLTWVSDDSPLRREQIRIFNRLHPDYFVELDPQNGGMEKIIVQSLGGVGPDFFDCYTVSQLSGFVRSGIAMDVTDEFAKRGIDLEGVWTSARSFCKLDGKAYGHPTNAASPGFWFNKRAFDEAGVPYPAEDWTWDDCIATSKRLTVRNERGIITRYGIIGPWDWRLALTQFGADWFTPEGTRCIVDSKAGIAAMAFFHSLIYEHEIMPTPQAQSALASAGGWGAGEITLFGAERGAMAIGARWWLAILRTPDYQHLDLGAVQVPGLRRPDGTLSHDVYGYGRATLVNARTKHKEGALLFQEYLHGREYNEMINRQADALAPVKKYCYTEEYLFNPAHPEEDYNEVWRTALENSQPMANSPYVNGSTVERLLQIQTDLLKGDLKDAASAMHDAARKINQEIIKTLERDENLRKRYLDDVANGAAPAWDDPSEIPWEDAA